MSVRKYCYAGDSGRHIEVYDDKCVITTKTTLFSAFNGTPGEKTIYYTDCIGVQFKKASWMLLGFLQLETASGTVHNDSNQWYAENSFPFAKNQVSNEEMEKVYEYVKERVEESKKMRSTPIMMAQSPADELKKYKELLDMGVITQEEFNEKKKQLLGL